MNVDQAVGTMRQIAEEEVVITHVVCDTLFLLRKMRKVNAVVFKTSNKWKIEVTFGSDGKAEYIRSAIGPDGRDVIGWNLVPMRDLMTPDYELAFNTELLSAIASTFPL